MSPLPQDFLVQRGVNVPGRLAAVLVTTGGLGDFARRVRGQDPQLDALLQAMTDEALHWTRTARARHGRDTAPAPAPGSPRHQGLSTGQAAKVVGCSVRTLQRLVDQGRLPAELVGGRYVVNPEDAEHLRAARTPR